MKRQSLNTQSTNLQPKKDEPRNTQSVNRHSMKFEQENRPQYHSTFLSEQDTKSELIIPPSIEKSRKSQSLK